jgi:hypothetical protein
MRDGLQRTSCTQCQYNFCMSKLWSCEYEFVAVSVGADREESKMMRKKIQELQSIITVMSNEYVGLKAKGSLAN